MSVAAITRLRGTREWLLSEIPVSRRQAALGSAYRHWLQFRRNGLAVTGLVIVSVLVLAALAAPLLATHSPDAQELTRRLQPPSPGNLLGTDELGRDLFSRLLYGGRVTLGIVVLIVIMVVPVGLAVGTFAGYHGGWVDRMFMRVTNIFLAFPRLVLALAFVAAIRPGVTSVIVAIALTTWPSFALLARSETLAIRNADFIAAVRLTGASSFRVVVRHVMPLCVPSMIVRASLETSGIVMTAAGLGFLGMGAQPPTAEWGAMIATSRGFLLQQWWVPTIPGLAILVASLGFNLLGDGLRDVLDPKQD